MIKIFPAICYRCLLAVFSVGLLASCGTSEDKAQTTDLLKKSTELKTEADQLAADAAGVQLKIKDLGGNDISGPEVLEGLLASENKAADEGARLADLQAGLEAANKKLSSEKEAFAGKYLKP